MVQWASASAVLCGQYKASAGRQPKGTAEEPNDSTTGRSSGQGSKWWELAECEDGVAEETEQLVNRWRPS